MGDDKRLTDEFVVHNYDTEAQDADGFERIEVAQAAGADVLVGGARERSGVASVLRSMSARLRGAASTKTADSAIAHAAESAANSADSLAQTIEEDGLQGVGERTADFVKSNSKAVAASAAGLALIAMRAWLKAGRRAEVRRAQ